MNSLPIGLIATSIAVYNERLAVILGILTLIAALTVFFSCRTCLKLLQKIGLKMLIARRAYQTFFKYHNYYWWIFWLILVIHLMAAIMHLGFNTTGDPDAYLHKYSVIFGVSALLLMVVIYFSCRGAISLIKLFSERPSSDFRLFSLVYQYHSYYWIMFFLLIAVHFFVGYKHSGWWPTQL